MPMGGGIFGDDTDESDEDAFTDRGLFGGNELHEASDMDTNPDCR